MLEEDLYKNADVLPRANDKCVVVGETRFRVIFNLEVIGLSCLFFFWLGA